MPHRTSPYGEVLGAAKSCLRSASVAARALTLRARRLSGTRPQPSSALSSASEEARLLLGLRGRGLRLWFGRRRCFLHRYRRLRCSRFLCRRSLLGRCSLGRRSLGRRSFLRCRLGRGLCSRLLGRRCFCLGGRSLGRCCFLHCRFCRSLRSRLLGGRCFCLGRGGLRLGSRCCFLHSGCGLCRHCLYWCFLCRCLLCR